MPHLLVSVVSPEEAEEALAGGADVIDVKDPARGPLGRADDDVILAIRDCVDGRRPVSAALGEYTHLDSPPYGLDFVKCGLAGMGGKPWHHRPVILQDCTRAHVVHVAYADWQCAQAPSVDEVLDYALRWKWPDPVMLIDTCCKDADHGGRLANLLDWLPLDDIGRLIRTAHEGNVRIALAGSLGPVEIAELAKRGPDWIAVRAAACDSSRRDGMVTRDAVGRIKSLLE